MENAQNSVSEEYSSAFCFYHYVNPQVYKPRNNPTMVQVEGGFNGCCQTPVIFTYDLGPSKSRCSRRYIYYLFFLDKIGETHFQLHRYATSTLPICGRNKEQKVSLKNLFRKNLIFLVMYTKYNSLIMLALQAIPSRNPLAAYVMCC